MFAAQLSSFAARARSFRWAVCSETFPGKSFAEICELTPADRLHGT